MHFARNLRPVLVLWFLFLFRKIKKYNTVILGKFLSIYLSFSPLRSEAFLVHKWSVSILRLHSCLVIYFKFFAEGFSWYNFCLPFSILASLSLKKSYSYYLVSAPYKEKEIPSFLRVSSQQNLPVFKAKRLKSNCFLFEPTGFSKFL